MNLSHTSCAYHSNRVAITVCERCRRPICLEDKRLYRKSFGSGRRSRRYHAPRDYCVFCNSSQLNSDFKRVIFLIGITVAAFLILFGTAFVYSFTSENEFQFQPFPIFLSIIIFGGIFLIVIINHQKKSKSARVDAIKLRNELDFAKGSKTTYTYNQKDKNMLYDLTCFKCGSNISLSDKYCRTCGDSTKDELMNI